MKKYWLIVLILILPSFSSLLRSGFFPFHDNLQPLRQLQMYKCITDFQIPCRWVPDMGFGFGYPLFNFYPPLPYLVGLPFVIFSIQNIDAVKTTIVISSLLAGVFMFSLLKSVTGNLKVAVTGSALFIYAPYRAVDIYVRGAINELWAITFFPAVFWSIYKVCKDNSRIHTGLLAIWLAGILLSHNPSAMIFFPAACLWTFACLKGVQKIPWKKLIFSGLVGLGLAGFFTLPVVFEQGFVHINTLTIGYFNYLAHFVSLGQLFLNPNWGYGGSELGTTDGMSFFVGYLHWVLPAVAACILALKRKLNIYFITFVLITIYASYMTHVRSSFIWDAISPLKYLQFPWRYLGVVAFSTSFLAAYAANNLNKKYLSILLAMTIVLNAQFFTPQTWNENETDKTIFSGSSWQRLIQASIFDYLPLSAPFPPAKQASGDINLVSGSGSISLRNKNSKEFTLTANLISPGTIRFDQFYFPGWTGEVNGTPVNVYADPADEIGRINIDIPQGESQIKIRFLDTPIRALGNIVTLVSIAILLLFFFKPYVKKFRFY